MATALVADWAIPPLSVPPPERDFPAGLDPDRFAGRRVSSHLRRPFPHLEDTEARQPVLSLFLKCFVASVTKLPRTASVAISVAVGRAPPVHSGWRLVSATRELFDPSNVEW
jgi:hypothetical protein